MTKVLIVDDSTFIRLALKKLLEQNEFEVVGEAENGKVALKKIQEFKPDIVTLDITMPVMNGLECLDEIKKLDEKPTVIIVSAMGQEANVKKAIMNGAKGFIVKPYQSDAVVKQMHGFRK